MPKPFLVVIISLLLIWILLLRAVFLIEDNSELLAEFSLDTIAEDAEGLSDFDRDYLILNIKNAVKVLRMMSSTTNYTSENLTESPNESSQKQIKYRKNVCVVTS